MAIEKEIYWLFYKPKDLPHLAIAKIRREHLHASCINTPDLTTLYVENKNHSSDTQSKKNRNFKFKYRR